MFKILNQNNFIFVAAIGIFLFGLYNCFNLIYYNTTIDVEHDYIGNALHINQFKNQFSIHHPSSILYYILSIILYFFEKSSFNLDIAIFISRSIFYSSCIFLLAISSLFISKNKFKFFLISIFYFTFCFPLFFYSTKLNAEAFIFCISLLFFVFSSKPSDKINLLLITFLFSLILSIKITSIILVPIIIFVLIKTSNNKRIFLLNFFKYFFIFFFTYLVFSIPIIGLLPITWIVSVKRVFILLNELNISISLFTIALFSITVILIFLIFKFYEQIKKLSIDNFNLIYFFILFSLVAFVSFNQNANKGFIFELILNLRHIIALLPLILIFYFKQKIFKFIYFFSLFLSLIFFYSFNDTLYKNENILDDYFLKNQDSNIFLFPNFNANSKLVFFEWSNYIYANNKINKNIIIFDKKIINNKNITFLNLRQHFDTTLTNDVKNELRKNSNFFVKLLDIREYIKEVRNKKSYNKPFFENAIYGFKPYFDSNYDICISQLNKELKNGKFLISNKDLNNSKYTKDQLLGLFTQCGFNYKIVYLEEFNINEISFY